MALNADAILSKKAKPGPSAARPIQIKLPFNTLFSYLKNALNMKGNH
jgi:hypothetical protein